MAVLTGGRRNLTRPCKAAGRRTGKEAGRKMCFVWKRQSTPLRQNSVRGNDNVSLFLKIG